MLSKEECLKAHEELCRMLVATDYLDGRAICTYPIMENELGTFYELIKEHFELVEKYEMLDNTYSMICEDFLNTQPYKFEDLKEGLWVWDKSYQEVCYIGSIVSKEKIYCEYLESHCSIEPYIIMPFEENRFFPVQMANVRCE